MENQLTFKQIAHRFNVLGFLVARNVKCPIIANKVWAYGTAPAKGGGGHGHFNNKSDLVEYLEELEKNKKFSE